MKYKTKSPFRAKTVLPGQASHVERAKSSGAKELWSVTGAVNIRVRLPPTANPDKCCSPTIYLVDRHTSGCPPMPLWLSNYSTLSYFWQQATGYLHLYLSR